MTLQQAAHLYAEVKQSRAEKDYHKISEACFAFALSAADAVGKRDGGTQELAELIRRKADTVERYARCGRFVQWAHKHNPTMFEEIRESLNFGFWMAVSSRMEDAEAWGWLITASEESCSLEEFRASLPKKPVTADKRLEKDIKALSRMQENVGILMDAMATEPTKVPLLRTYYQALKIAKDAAQECTEN